jgi:predicted amidophosphoribosyltransferase
MIEPTLTTKTVADYSDAERANFKEQFQRTARIYSIGRISGLLASLALVALIGYLRNPGPSLFWLCMAGLGVIGVPLVLILASPSPKCPACRRVVERELANFCPECGGTLDENTCGSCKKTLRFGKGRSYWIKYCTHCGVQLDDGGI